MPNKIAIACLPLAGMENPYQYLMIAGLNEAENIQAFNGVHDKFFGIIRTQVRYRPDYIHFDWIHSYYIRRRLWMTLLLLPLFYLQIIYVRYFTKTKMVWTLHNILPHGASQLKLHKTVRRFFGNSCKWIRVFADSSVGKASEILAIPKDKFIVLPEGDYIGEYPNTITRKQARDRLKIEANKKVLLYLGYIKPYKGLESLIKEFSKINNKEWELIMAGKSMDSTYLNKLTDLYKGNKNIKLINAFIEPEELQVYYNAADAVVLPFKKIENSGSAIMAMGFKKAILAPSIGVLTIRLAKQQNLLYSDLNQGLKAIFAMNKAELKKMGEQNFEYLKQHSWKDFAKVF